jgi:AraC family transcriptional regulator, ethanolamine operon transcriptional activator
LKAVRLNGVRKQLRHADTSTTRVADVANDWGFWHMGQFAADYKAFFSEKPLETLHCMP